MSIEVLDVAPLFGDACRARAAADRRLMELAARDGFLLIEGLPAGAPVGGRAREALLRFFDLPEEERGALRRRAGAPGEGNVYRGYFGLDEGIIKAGIDIGPERPVAARADDALAERTPLPADERLPGFRAAVRWSHAALGHVGDVMMRAIARGLGLREDHFEACFEDGNSTLRLIVYPAWPPLADRHGLALQPLVDATGRRRYEIGGAHVDSGFVTLLQQDEVGGLQARASDGSWVDVPPREGTLVVNFGALLERWTSGRVRATEHRVLGNDVVRHSIPFFYEPRIDARIEPLPGGEAFEPFRYGDHLWAAMTKFSEFARAQRYSAAPPEASA